MPGGEVRVHRGTGKRPLDAHDEEQPHLLPFPAQHYDTAQINQAAADLP